MNDLNFKEFLKKVVLETTPEDQKDITFFELRDWADSEFVGIPSCEVQRYVDKNIPIWLESQETAQTFVKNLCEIELKQLGIRSAAIAARHAVENYWNNVEGDNRPIAAVELLEKWLSDETSVSQEELRTTGNAAWAAAYAARAAANSARAAAYAAANAAAYAAAYSAAYATVYATAYSAAYSANAANAAGYAANAEICEIIQDKLPKFNFEDLVRWEYFPG